MTIYYHGSRSGTIPSGRVFFAASQEYAMGYGKVAAVDIDEASLRILDLSYIQSGPSLAFDFAAALEVMQDHGLDTDQMCDLGDEAQGLVEQIMSKVAIEDKFDAIKIYEWTAGIGETVSLCVFDFIGGIPRGETK